jgi:hypothetical protein
MELFHETITDYPGAAYLWKGILYVPRPYGNVF